VVSKLYIIMPNLPNLPILRTTYPFILIPIPMSEPFPTDRHKRESNDIILYKQKGKGALSRGLTFTCLSYVPPIPLYAQHLLSTTHLL